MLPGILIAFAARVPVDPDAPKARQWLIHELGKPPYQAAKPTWFDQASKAFWDWLSSLVAPTGSGWAGLVPLVITLVVVAVIVGAFFLFGLPRLNRRRRTTPALFGEDDRRTAAEIRRHAADAARQDDWARAIADAYRALARGLQERGIVEVYPGTTARAVAEDAARAFGTDRDRLVDAAGCFEAVRYGSAAGSPAEYRTISALDDQLAHRSPAALPDVSGAPV